MSNCRACGGVLGRDCYNESDCLQISMSNEQDMYSNNFELQNYVSILIYTMEQKGITIPNSFAAEPPLIMKTPHTCETNPMESDLPW